VVPRRGIRLLFELLKSHRTFLGGNLQLAMMDDRKSGPRRVAR
jgi:hypothetical protein